MFSADRFVAKDQRAVQVMRELCDNINSDAPIPTPDHVRVVRRRIMKYLTNALAYNVNYKDLGHTNIVHFTNFPMYPLSEPGTGVTETNMYPFLRRLFANTLMINGGYTDHCHRLIIGHRESESPFVTRRDFDFMLVYFVLTGAVQLSKTVCRSYLFKGSFNPLNDVYKAFMVASILSRARHKSRSTASWVPHRDGYWYLRTATGPLSRDDIAMSLKHCGGYKIQHWSPDRVRAICDAVRVIDPIYRTEYESIVNLVSADKGIYLINGDNGLIINYKDCHPQVYVWNSTGIFRFDTLMDYLCSQMGARIHSVERIGEY